MIGEFVLRGLDVDEKIVREKLRAFITRDLIRDDEYQLTDDEGIITGGLMDSFALAEFAVFVESEFGVYIPDSDLTVAKMDTLDQMVARVTGG
jgi:acyl carrier protein